MSDNDELSVFDPIPETRESVGECRRCGVDLYFLPNPDDYDPYALPQVA